MVNGEKEIWIRVPREIRNKHSVNVIAVSNRGRMMRQSGKIDLIPCRHKIKINGKTILTYVFLAKHFIRKTQEDIMQNRNCIDHITHTPQGMYINDIRNIRWCSYKENRNFEECKTNFSKSRKTYIGISIEEHYGKPLCELKKEYNKDRVYYKRHGKFPWE